MADMGGSNTLDPGTDKTEAEMRKPYWSVINTNTGEEIIRVKAEKDIETVHRMVAQWFEEEWEDCGDQVRIIKVRP